MLFILIACNSEPFRAAYHSKEKLIHSADPQSRPVVIIIFGHVVRPFVRPSPLFKSRKTKQQKTMFATGVTLGLAEWIIDDTCLVSFMFKDQQRKRINSAKIDVSQRGIMAYR